MALDRIIHLRDTTIVDWEDYDYTTGTACGGCQLQDGVTQQPLYDRSSFGIGANNRGITDLWLAVTAPLNSLVVFNHSIRPDPGDIFAAEIEGYRLFIEVGTKPGRINAYNITSLIWTGILGAPTASVPLSRSTEVKWRKSTEAERSRAGSLPMGDPVWAEVIAVEYQYDLAKLAELPEPKRLIDFRVRYDDSINFLKAVWYDGFRYDILGITEVGRRNYLDLRCARTILGRIYE